MTTERDAGPSPAVRHVATALTGGQSGAGSSPGRGGSSGRDAYPANGTAAPAGRRGSAAAQDSGYEPVSAPDAVADPWPSWARPQLLEAAALASRVDTRTRGRALAGELYRHWYSPAIGSPVEFSRAGRPLAGIYRTAHAGSGNRILADGIALVDRNDAVGRDGWWRTWGDAWRPTDSRRRCVRILLSPHPAALADFVGTATAALLQVDAPWLLACTTDPRRLSRSGSRGALRPRRSRPTRGFAHPAAPTAAADRATAVPAARTRCRAGRVPGQRWQLRTAALPPRFTGHEAAGCQRHAPCRRSPRYSPRTASIRALPTAASRR